jgi:hypothetical protein
LAFVDFSNRHHLHGCACEECFVSSKEHKRCQVSYDEVYVELSTQFRNDVCRDACKSAC